MAADQNLTDLRPQNTREWLVHLNNRFDALEESQAEDRETMLSILKEQKELNKCMDDRLKLLEGTARAHTEAIDTLKKSQKSWDIGSILVGLGAFITALFGLKGS